MDHFGIGSAIKGAIHTYFQSARGTGRTVSMLESIKNKDRIIFTNNKEADRVKRLLPDYDLNNVKCIVVDPQHPERLLEHGTNQGRTIFDHSWVEEFYKIAINHCEKSIDFFQLEMSKWGESHRKTRRQAVEIAKWSF